MLECSHGGLIEDSLISEQLIICRSGGEGQTSAFGLTDSTLTAFVVQPAAPSIRSNQVDAKPTKSLCRLHSLTASLFQPRRLVLKACPLLASTQPSLRSGDNSSQFFALTAEHINQPFDLSF